MISTMTLAIPLWDQSLFWVAVAVFLFVVLFGRKIWSVVTELLDARANRIRADLDEAAALKREAQDMLAKALAQREEALAEAKMLLQNAHVEAARVAEAAIAEAAALGKRREQLALERISAAEKAATDEVRLAAAEIATQAARQMLAEGLSASADAALIDQAITRLPSALSRQAA